MEDTLTYQQAANELAITYGSVKQLVTNGKLHSIKVPRSKEKRIARSEIQRYRMNKAGSLTEQREVTPTTPVTTATLGETWHTTPEMVKRGQIGVVIQSVLSHSSEELAHYRDMIERYGNMLSTHLDTLAQVIGPVSQQVLDHDVTREEMETLIYEQRIATRQALMQ